VSGPAGEGRLALRLGLLFVVGGLAIEALYLAVGGWPSPGPLLIAGIGVPPLVLGLLARREPREGGRAPLLIRRSGVVSALFLAAAVVGLLLSVGSEREERHEMTWSFETDARGTPDRSRVLLEFVEHPGWVSKIHSRDLGEYLASLPTDRVPVVFRVTRDLGTVRGFIEVQVGDRRSWTDLGGGGFSRRTTARSRERGTIGPSPFR
jgi:hypothetical protein